MSLQNNAFNGVLGGTCVETWNANFFCMGGPCRSFKGTITRLAHVEAIILNSRLVFQCSLVEFPMNVLQNVNNPIRFCKYMHFN